MSCTSSTHWKKVNENTSTNVEKEVGNKIKATKDGYESAMSKLYEGKGNIVKSVEKLKILGAKTTKSIDQKLLDRAEE